MQPEAVGSEVGIIIIQRFGSEWELSLLKQGKVNLKSCLAPSIVSTRIETVYHTYNIQCSFVFTFNMYIQATVTH